MKIQSQEDIDRLSIEYRILQHMIRYQVCDDTLGWDSSSISNRIGIEFKSDTAIILNRLYDLGYVRKSFVRGVQWFITQDGIDAFIEQTKDVRINTGNLYQEFKEEVLTGTDKYGKETKIKNAVLKTAEHYDFHRNSVEDNVINACSMVENIRDMSNYYGESFDDTKRMFETGEIHVCKKCGRHRRFHKKNYKDGTSWQTLCIECRKMDRRK